MKKFSLVLLVVLLNISLAFGDGIRLHQSSNSAAVALNTTHRTSDGTDHAYIDQDVTIGAAPSLAGTNVTGVVQDGDFTINSGVLVGTGAGTFVEETGATLLTSVGADPIGTDNSTDVTLDVSATTGGMSIATQAISNRAATNAQTGYATAAQITTLESALQSVVEDETPQLYADLDGQGNYLTDVQNIPDVASKGSGNWFDGVDDVTVVADDPNIDVGTSDFYIEISITPYAVTRATDYIVNKEAGGIGYGLYINEDDLYIRFDDNTTDVSAIIGTAVFTDYVKADILVVFERDGNATAYVNGKSVGTVAISTANLTLSNAGDLHIGQDSAGGNEFLGEIWKHKVGSLALTTAEVKAFSSGAPVPYKYIGASQTEVMADLPASHDFLITSPQDGWNLYGTPTVCSTDVASKLTVTADAENEGVSRSVTTKVGKRYRLTFDFTIADNDGERLQIYGNNWTKTSTSNFSTNGTYDVFFTATATSVLIYFRSDLYVDGFTFTVDNPSVTQIGCVLQLEQDGIGHNQWLDKSGNNLNGTNSGALPTNLPVNHVEKYIDLTVTANTTFTLPLGYMITNIIVRNTTANEITGGLDVGYSEGSAEIVNAMAVAANAEVVCTLISTGVLGANFDDASDVIHVAATTNWNGASIKLRVVMQQIN